MASTIRPRPVPDMSKLSMTSPSRRTVARSVISMTSSMSCDTKMMLTPSSVSRRIMAKEFAHILHRQERRRLVEDEDARTDSPSPRQAIRSAARTMASCARFTGERSATAVAGSRFEMMALEQAPRALGFAVPVDEPAADTAMVTGDQVFEYRGLRKKPEILMDERKAEALAASGRDRQCNRIPVDPEGALVRR